MAQAQKKLRENSNLQFPQGQHWSTWKRAMVPLYNGTNTVNRHQNQAGFIWKYILYDGNLRMASYSTGPAKSSRLRWKHVLKLWPLWTTAKQNIVGYCSHGNHKADLINDALTRGYTLEVRYNQAWNETQARELENELLDMYDYAWNVRRNGNIRAVLWYEGGE